jgi:hypothetical protein
VKTKEVEIIRLRALVKEKEAALSFAEAENEMALARANQQLDKVLTELHT